jgi:hypothetical protein
MSKRRALLVLSFAAPGALAAQSVAQLEADSARLFAQLRAASLATQDHRPAIGDTLREGGMPIVAPRAALPLMRDGARQLLARLRPTLGEMTDSLAASMQITVKTFPTRVIPTVLDRLRGRRLDTRYQLYVADVNGGAYSTDLGTSPTAGSISSALELGFTEAMSRRLDPAFRAFTDRALHLTPRSDEFWSSLERGMTIRAGVNRRCLAGSDADCALAMGLRPTASPAEWYDANDLRSLLGDLFPNTRSEVVREVGDSTLTRCTRDGVLAQCQRAFGALRFAEMQSPMPPQARALLVRVALERGGGAGLRRLDRARGADVAVQLEALGGTSVPQLLADWRARLRASHPRPSEALPLLTLSSVVWLALVLALSQRRRTWES